jgi:predicted HAD superfamily Cof-like phosphohydrolase
MTTIREQVIEFHKAFDQPIVERPSVPGDDRVRLRARLVAEEFFEMVASMFDQATSTTNMPLKGLLLESKARVDLFIRHARVVVDLPELADAFADLDYVVEGSRIEFGIDGAPIAAEVHRSNMAKVGGATAPDGKKMKPPGWVGPDIEGCLKAQGWKP